MASKPMTIGDLYRRMGPARFFGMWAVLIAWVALGIYLMRWSHVRTICPGSGKGIIELVKTLACSPALLRGDAMDYGVFLWMWSIPAALVALLLWARAYAQKVTATARRVD